MLSSLTVSESLSHFQGLIADPISCLIAKELSFENYLFNLWKHISKHKILDYSCKEYI